MTESDDLFGAAPRKGAAGKPAKSGTADYDAHSIEVLEGLEPVRRRPGMYIGGTDETAMHHLFAEVLDNAMDEAVAGHATFIAVTVEPDGWLTVADNGRGIPVGMHPKMKDKTALEVVMTMLHAGGKFDSGAYQTSGGLHGVGVSVVNALAEKLEVDVAIDQRHYRQEFSRGVPLGPLAEARQGCKTSAARRCASSRTRKSSAPARIGSPRGSSACRAPRPISSAASKSAGVARRN